MKLIHGIKSQVLIRYLNIPGITIPNLYAHPALFLGVENFTDPPPDFEGLYEEKAGVMVDFIATDNGYRVLEMYLLKDVLTYEIKNIFDLKSLVHKTDIFYFISFLITALKKAGADMPKSYTIISVIKSFFPDVVITSQIEKYINHLLGL